MVQMAESEPSNVLPSKISQTLKWAPSGLTEHEVIRALNELFDLGFIYCPDTSELDIDPGIDEIRSLKSGGGWEISTTGKAVAHNGRSVWQPDGPGAFTITGGDFRNSNIAAGSGVYQTGSR
jgi:hypothetical protein